MAAVCLWVYDISDEISRLFVKQTMNIDVKGIWHTSVVVYGLEYYFQQEIRAAAPGSTYFGAPVNRIEVGETAISKEEFEKFLNTKRETYTSSTYNLLKNNCNHFTDTALMFLVGKGVPEYISELSRLVDASPFGKIFRSSFDLSEN